MSGDRRSLVGRAGLGRYLAAWTEQPWPSSCAGDAMRCVPSTSGLSSGLAGAPGLRWEEVASLAAMSTDYYTRLERRRARQPSEQMLAALARALRLTADDRDYLFVTAGRNPPQAFSPSARTLRPACCGCSTGSPTPRRSSFPAWVRHWCRTTWPQPFSVTRAGTAGWPAARCTGGSPIPRSACAIPSTGTAEPGAGRGPAGRARTDGAEFPCR